MCQGDKSHLFHVCRTFWKFEKGISKAFMSTLLAKKVSPNVTPRSGSKCSLISLINLQQQAISWRMFLFLSFFPLSLQLYDSSSCLIHSLSEKVCNCRAVTTTDLGLPCLSTTVFLLLSLLIFNFIVQCRTALYTYIYIHKNFKMASVYQK